LEATCQTWDYNKRILVAEKVEKFKAKLEDLEGKQRAEVSKLIANCPSPWANMWI